MAKLTTKQRKAMPASEFAGGKPKGKPEGSFPLNDKAHIANAESRERFASPAEKKRIDAAAAKAFPEGKHGKSAAERVYPKQGKK